MHLRYVLLLVMATIVASTSITSAATFRDDTKPRKVNSVDSAHDEQEFVRSLLADDDTLDKKQRFMEHKLQKALTNPKKTEKLYQYWSKKGYTVKQISVDLGQTENRELNQTYKKLSEGYAAFLKGQ